MLSNDPDNIERYSRNDPFEKKSNVITKNIVQGVDRTQISK